MIGGMPSAEGEPYFSHVPPVDGAIHFPGWEAFEGPDTDDLTAEHRAQFARHTPTPRRPPRR